jgi:NADH:ubiquinone oxidoreductase subunit 2 (subunit N)
MNMQIVNRICYVIAIVCIIAGVAYGLTLVWVESWRVDAWKGLATLSIVFLGAIMTLSVNQVFMRGGRRRDT